MTRRPIGTASTKITKLRKLSISHTTGAAATCLVRDHGLRRRFGVLATVGSSERTHWSSFSQSLSSQPS